MLELHSDLIWFLYSVGAIKKSDKAYFKDSGLVVSNWFMCSKQVTFPVQQDAI